MQILAALKTLTHVGKGPCQTSHAHWLGQGALAMLPYSQQALLSIAGTHPKDMTKAVARDCNFEQMACHKKERMACCVTYLA